MRPKGAPFFLRRYPFLAPIVRKSAEQNRSGRGFPRDQNFPAVRLLTSRAEPGGRFAWATGKGTSSLVPIQLA